MKMSRSKRLAERFLTMLLPRQWSDALIGDLREEAIENVKYWREVVLALFRAVIRVLSPEDDFCEEDVMTVVGTATRRPIAFILALGVLGGGILITTTILSHRGPLVFLPYAAIVLAGAAYLRLEKVQPFSRRFSLSLGAFMLATVILYLFIGTVATHNLLKISILGHSWRIGFMLLIGSILSAAVAQLTGTITTTSSTVPS